MGEDDNSGQQNLTSLDQQNLEVLKPQLDAIGVNLPKAVLEHIAVLGRESDVRKGTFISYELDQIHVCERYSDNLKKVFFQEAKEIRVKFKGEECVINEQTLDQDIKYMILLNDIGKAGWNEESRKVVPKIYNNIQMRPGVHDVWIKSHKEEVVSFMQEAGVHLQAFEKAVDGGDFMNLPVSVMVEVSRKVAEANIDVFPQAAGLSLSQEDMDILVLGGADPRSTTMREFYDKHVEWGEKFLEANITDRRIMTLAIIGLMHHYSQDYLPKSYKNGQLELKEDALRLVAWIQLLDMADGAMKRSGQTPDKLHESVLSLANRQKRGDDASERFGRLLDLSEYFDWEEIGKLLGERGMSEEVELKDQSERIKLKMLQKTRKSTFPNLAS